MTFSGICTVSKTKPWSRATSSMYKWMWGSLCPVKPIYRILPALCPSTSARSPVDLCHQKDLPPVAIPECRSHSGLARTVVAVPAVVQEVDATVDRRSNDPEAELLVDAF